jgi:hypothetical protein
MFVGQSSTQEIVEFFSGFSCGRIVKCRQILCFIISHVPTDHQLARVLMSLGPFKGLEAVDVSVFRCFST